MYVWIIVDLPIVLSITSLNFQKKTFAIYAFILINFTNKCSKWQNNLQSFNRNDQEMKLWDHLQEYQTYLIYIAHSLICQLFCFRSSCTAKGIKLGYFLGILFITHQTKTQHLFLNRQGWTFTHGIHKLKKEILANFYVLFFFSIALSLSLSCLLCFSLSLTSPFHLFLSLSLYSIPFSFFFFFFFFISFLHKFSFPLMYTAYLSACLTYVHIYTASYSQFGFLPLFNIFLPAFSGLSKATEISRNVSICHWLVWLFGNLIICPLIGLDIITSTQYLSFGGFWASAAAYINSAITLLSSITFCPQ